MILSELCFDTLIQEVAIDSTKTDAYEKSKPKKHLKMMVNQITAVVKMILIVIKLKYLLITIHFM